MEIQQLNLRSMLFVLAKSPIVNTIVSGYINGLIIYLPRGGWKIHGKYALPDLLPMTFCQPVLGHEDSEQETVVASEKALKALLL